MECDPNHCTFGNADFRSTLEENADLREHLKIALRQWKLYSEMAEANDGFDLASDKSQEGDLYRAAYCRAHGQSSHE